MSGEEGAEKTEDATPKRQEDARQQGQIARSKELVNMILLFSSAFIFMLYGEHLGGELKKIFVESFQLGRQETLDDKWILIHLSESLSTVLTAVIPILLVFLFGAVIGNILLGGFNYSIESVSFKLERIDPIAGLKKIISIRSLVELGKSVLKILVLFATFYFYVYPQISMIFAMDQMPLSTAIPESLNVLLQTGLVMTTPLIIITLIDVPYQVWNMSQQLKMTKQEVKDESKNTEGQPEVKAKLRQMQSQMRNRRMMNDVPEADVVITNPTHFAVALKYKEEAMNTPVVIAKGLDHMCEMIKKVAIANNVIIVEAPPLARSLYYNVELDDPIPEELFIAVAKILAYVYELNLFKRGKAQKPILPKEYDIPESFAR